jgi:hypothetical protein
MATTGFQDGFPLDVRQSPDVMIELDPRPIRFVLGGERDVHRWIGLERIVKEGYSIRLDFYGKVRIPVFPDGLADGSIGQKVVDE